MLISDSSSRMFYASDGVEYKWKQEAETEVLVVHTKDKSLDHTPIATFTREKQSLLKSHSHGAYLSITSQGTRIIDEIVATLIWVDDKRGQFEEAATSAPG